MYKDKDLQHHYDEEYFSGRFRPKLWSRRAQEYEQKITSGKIYDLAEVVRDLNKGDDIMVDQSYSERQLFEKHTKEYCQNFK